MQIHFRKQQTLVLVLTAALTVSHTLPLLHKPVLETREGLFGILATIKEEVIRLKLLPIQPELTALH